MWSESQDGLVTARSDLRHLVLAQYAYFAEHQSYATNLEDLMAETEFRMTVGNEGEVSGDRAGFTATVRRTDASGPPDRAIIWIGDHAQRASRILGVIYCE